MATAREFVALALKEAGVLGVGQTALAEDINDGFTLLTRMLSQWQKRRWLVPMLYEVVAKGNGARSNPIGPGQYYNSARPDKIQAAYFVQLNNQGGSNRVSYPLWPIWSYENYVNVALKDLNSWPTHFFYDGAFPYGNVHIWPIPDNNIEVHLVIKGPIGFTTEIDTVAIVTAGAGYTNGAYQAVPLYNVTGYGAEATADITIAGGVVTSIAINNAGDGYRINDFLTISAADVGGTGTGFTAKITNMGSSLDAEFNMPPEYEEAIHYNLCVRLTSMYQMPPNPVQGKLAVIALNTLRSANAQVPTLSMPSNLRFSGNNGFYIFNADAR